MYDYKGNHQSLEEVIFEKDLGITVDKDLNFRKHVSPIVSKANSTLGIIRRSFRYLDRNTIMLLYKALIRPILEYGLPAWSPFYKREQEAIEAVQRRATKLIPGFSELPYEVRLERLNLFSLAHRRLRGDMLFIYKYLHGLITTDHLLFTRSTISVTRGHLYKLDKPRFSSLRRQSFLTQRAINHWNALPELVVDSPSLDAFKWRLNRFWSNKPGLYSIDGDN
ncbi:hypothetical protein HOLleu_34249 [Holothuria leucospilota]|uniref:Uncharacterized protein n=1 Tax=Holothuria leucospilota TaxID=206669 RepID=A0A9Q0YKR7_HOLLE|nr:hypothetical protein HOLleu_34249 [Holothuria leucospilota]